MVDRSESPKAPELGDWRTYNSDRMDPILRAALGCFAQQGYHGTSIRQIASTAGLSVPGVYHHYPSKQALLVAVMRHAMEDLWWRSEEAGRESAGEGAAGLLAAQVECLVLYHARRQDLAFVAWSEIRSLEPNSHVEHLERRDRQQRVFDRILDLGAETGDFLTPWPTGTSRAIVTLCTAVAQWYRPSGQMAPKELAENYTSLALVMAKAKGKDGAATT